MKARRTVLLVEDQPSLRKSLHQTLQRMGFEVLEAPDASTAIERLKKSDPDLVCVELVLPEATGYEVCEFIRRSPRHWQVPVLMMSGRGYPQDRACAIEAGANAFLIKPFTEQEFRQRVEALMGERARILELGMRWNRA